MFLIDDDDTRIGERRQHRQPRAYDDARLALANTAPLIGPLALRQTTVQNRDLDRQVVSQALEQRQGQGDLGHEDNATPADRQRRAQCFGVDSCFAAGSGALDQQHGVVAAADQGADSLDDRGLRRAEFASCGHRTTRGCGPVGQRPPRDLARLEHHDTLLGQRAQRTVAMALTKRRGGQRLAGDTQLIE